MVGAVIGNYQLIQKLGEGGMGAVYLGQHALLGRRAAVKVLLPELSARPDIVHRFFNEARAVTSISDPGIVQVFDFGYHSDGSAFIVMEFLEGEPLDRRLARLGRLSAVEALRLGRQLASSLAAAHAQRIVHRDLKPENIFLVPDAEVASGERTKILDFGIAKLSDDHPGKLKTSTGMLMGTPVYMSPEQCRGLPDVDHRSDIYALGCVLFHLMTGRPPFEGEAPGDVIVAHIREMAPVPSSYVPEILPSVDALVLRCLAKAPADRFQTMGEVGAAIGQILQQVTSGAPVGATPGYPVLPTAAPPGGAQVTPYGLQAGVGHPAMATGTTLGASVGQLAAASRPRRTGLWIGLAAGLVVGAAAIAIVIVGPRGSGDSHAVSEPTEPTLARVGSSSGGGGSGNGEVPVAEDAGVAMGEAPKVPPDAAEQVAVGAIDAGLAVPAAGSGQAVEPPAEGPSGAPAHEPKRKGRRRRVAESPQHEEPPRASRSPQPPAKPPQVSPQTPAKPPAGKCAKTVFAAVYNAAAPSKEAIKAALNSLRECHTAGAISEADYNQTQAALVAKLMSGS